jgi:CHAD domain-containing protein
MRKKFTATHSVSEQFREIAGTELTQALKSAAEPGKAPSERVHGARLNFKRLRALLRLVRPAFPQFSALNRQARDAARSLSPLRDVTVLKDTLAALLEDKPEAPADAVAQFKTALEARVPDAAAQDEILAAFTRAALPILGHVPGWRLTSDDPGILTEGAARTYRKVRKTMDEARRRGAPEHFHEWRKQVKHQLYELEFIDGLAPAKSAPRRRLKRLATLLGEHHDQTVFRAFLATRPERSQLAVLGKAASKVQQKLEAKSLKLGAKLFRLRPRKWRARLAAGELPQHAQIPGAGGGN